MEYNLTQIVFLLTTAITAPVGLLIYSVEEHLPVTITRTFCYGKYAVLVDNSFVARFEVPKRWFKHFYRFAAPVSSFVLALAVSKYIYKNNIPNFVYTILDLLCGTHRRALVSPESCLLATILLTIQCWKRLYETHCVSIFSDGKMNLSHYIIGFVHYVGVAVSVIGESEGFVKGTSGILHWHRVTTLQYVCAVIFLWSSFEQLQTNYILANLRKSKKGEIVTKSYKVPHGRLYEYISAPLQFSEIIMYTMLFIIMWESSTYQYVYFWVLANQAATAAKTHRWFLQTFGDYPKHRKILVPKLW